MSAISKVVLIVEMRDAMTKKLVGYWALMTRRARNAMPSCRTQCDLQDRADADFYAVGFGFITPRPLLRQLTNALPMHYKLDPKVIDASSVPSFDSLPIHHKIHPQLIDAYIASTKCVARLQLRLLGRWRPWSIEGARASVRGRFPNVHVFEIHRLVARWLSFSIHASV